MELIFSTGLLISLFLQLSKINGQVADEMIGPDSINTYQQSQELDVRSIVDSLNKLAELICLDDPDSCNAIASIFSSVNQTLK
jgi:hypothetical protein